MSSSTTEYINVAHEVRTIQNIEDLSYEEIEAKAHELTELLRGNQLNERQREEIGRALGWATFELSMREQELVDITANVQPEATKY